MKKWVQRIPEQAVRVIVLFAVLTAVLFVIRQFLLPVELKDTVFQKVAATEREAAREIRYAGGAVCGQCHERAVEAKKGGHHRDLSCESCHGAAERHVHDPGVVKPSSPRKRDDCSYCHRYNSSRPTGFPQINPDMHHPRQACISCHEAHNPKPPTPPRSCAACHAQIERTKAASAHSQVACTVCHKTPEKHKSAPRSVAPSKPETREFCGGCHAEGSAKKGVPAVDLATHGEKYVCWQCHYPHMTGGI